MELLLVLLFGLVVGIVARLIVPGREPGGWIASIGLGVAGSFLGTYLGRLFGLYQEGQPAGFLMSVVGAALLLLGYHALIKRRVHT
jgi:uncharacterized membrane protein YeaQ/YmgE (transglycosylase-associated protein family)